MTAMIARAPGASPDAVMKAKGATSTAPTLSEKKVVVVGGTAGRRAKNRHGAKELAERADSLYADDERDAYQADHEPQGLDAVYLRAAVEERGEERDEHGHRGEEHAG
jgi:hypothetical protein